MSQNIINKIVRSKRRTLALVVTADAQLIVRAPFAMPNSVIKNFIFKKTRWIRKYQEIARIKKINTKPKQFICGEHFFYLGKAYKFRTVDSRNICLTEFLEFPKRMLPQARKHIIKWYKTQALKVISQRTSLYAKFAGLKYRTIRISSAKKRFGSCGSKNTLNFSWRLAIAPLGAIDYVVVHELSHLKVKNHSRKFWETIKRIMPEYKKYHKWLKENGHLLII
ncbi:MAG: M48 family metallopeptidase [Omnitrophica bacterium]|nr:M48 family metallopeptidase [Candidatus Omnitrophota bacterium]